MLGVISTDQAKRIARESGLDLVEVSPTANPPVCRIMDYGKFQYTQNRKQKLNKKAGATHAVKEVKFRASTEDHDYQTKVNKIKQFLEKGHKVKVTLFFRGRENAHRELGFDQINRVLQDCDECANVEMQPKMVGRTLVSMIAPKSAKGR
jgi:translation initiation factor IF-3